MEMTTNENSAESEEDGFRPTSRSTQEGDDDDDDDKKNEGKGPTTLRTGVIRTVKPAEVSFKN